MMTPEQSLTCAIDIGEQLLRSGAEISRAEDTITRICGAYSAVCTHVFCITSSVVVTLQTKDGQYYTQTRRIREYSTDLDRIDKLNELSRYICRDLPDWETARDAYHRIIQSAGYSLFAQCMTGAMIAAAFTMFFGGNLRDAAAALPVGGLLRLLLFTLQKLRLNSVLMNLLCSLICGCAAILTYHVSLCENLDKIIIGNIMLLIPGVVLTNSIRDMLSGDMMTGILRFCEAIVTAVAVATGFVIATLLLGGWAT